ncbi:MAG: Gfo/Idh/MocA family oxidoreductase [Caulobacterales bacterium]|nr:Gfo/Idh/MocA family oxidoreductase [Caulobacterales bacterium]MCA0373368.1 Gfo/Idh/MocA family oxidoreductase [Pseudomonadota bacterium]
MKRTVTNLKIAVVGCGYWGKNLVRNFSELGVLAAVVDGHEPSAMKMSEIYNVPVKTFEEVLDDASIDGLVIAAPAEIHAELAIRGFEAGKHIYVEKPIALTVNDAELAKAAANKAGKILMVGHLLQYHPAFEKLLSMVKAGELGKLQYAYSHRLSLGKFRVEENALWSLAPHDASMILALFGEEPYKVTATGSAFITKGVEDECRLDLEFPDGGRAHIFVSWLHPFKEQRLTIIGDKASAVFEDSAQGQEKLRLYRHKIDTSGVVPNPIKADVEYIEFGNGEPLKQECQHFLDAMSGIVKTRTDADEAIAVLKVLKA